MPAVRMITFGIAVAMLGAVAPRAFAQDKVTYQDHILPVFRNACLNCHNPDKKKAGLDLSTFAGVIAGGGSGKAIEPGDPDGSLLYRLVTHAEEPNMPPKGDKLPDKELDLIKRWILGGVLESSGSTAIGSAKPKLDLKIEASAAGKPDGPPPMPGELLLEPPVHTSKPGAVMAMASSPWAPLVAVGGQKQVLLYDPRTRDLLGVIPFPAGFPNVIKFSRSGKLLLVAGGVGAKAGKAVLFDVATGNRVTEVGEELDAVLAADVSPDQSLVALGGPSKVVKIFSTATGAMVGKIRKHTDWITAVTFSPDGVLLATGDRNGGVIVWEADSANELYTLPGHKASVTDLAFRGDSNVLASSGEDGDVKLWNMADGKPIKSWAADKDGVLSIDFAADGRLVSAGRENRLKLWKPDGSGLKTFNPPFGDVALHAVFDNSDGGKLVVGADWTGAVQVFDVQSAKPLGTLDPNPPPIAQRIELASAKLNEVQAATEKVKTEFAKLRETAAQIAAEKQDAETALRGLGKAIDEAKAAAEGAARAQQDASTALDTAKADARVTASERDRTLQISLRALADQAVAASESEAVSQELSTKQAAASAAMDAAARAKTAAELAPQDKVLAKAAADAKATADAAIEQLATAQRAFGAKSGEVSTLTNAAQLAATSADTAADAVADAQQSIEDARKTIAQAVADVEGAKRELAEAEESRSSTAATLTKVNERLERITAAVARMSPQAEKAAGEVAEAKAQVARLTAGQFFTQVYAARQELLARKAESDAATAGAQAAQAAADKAVADVPAFEKRIAAFDEIIAAAERAVPIARQTASAAANIAKGLESIAAEREAFVKQLRDQADKIADLSSNDPANKNLADAVAASKTTADLIAGELEKLRQSAKAQQRVAKLAADAVGDAVARLEKEKSAKGNAPQTLASLRSAIPAAQATAAEKKRRADATARKFEEANAKSSQLEAQYADLKKQLGVAVVAKAPALPPDSSIAVEK